MLYATSTHRFEAAFDSSGFELGAYAVRLTTRSQSGAVLDTRSLAFQMESAFVLSVMPAKTLYGRAQTVELAGSAFDTAGSPIGGLPVTVSLAVRGFVRNYTTATTANGSFALSFTPPATEAGNYTATVTATRNGLTRSASTPFVVLGLLLEPSGVAATMSMNSSLQVPFRLRNVGDQDLSGVTIGLADLDPADGITAASSLPELPLLLRGMAQDVTVTITAPAGEPPSTLSRFTVTATSAEGEVEVVPIQTTLRRAVAIPVVTPISQKVGLRPGDTRTVVLTIKNEGYATMAGTRVQVADAALFPWVGVTADAIGDIAPGESRQISVSLVPPSTLSLGSYSMRLDVTSTSGTVSAGLLAELTSATVGGLSLSVFDDAGRDVAQAGVTVYSDSLYKWVSGTSQQALNKVYSGTTDQAGKLELRDLASGVYKMQVNAPGHEPYEAEVTVEPGEPTAASAALSTEVARFEFKVSETTVTEEYKIVIDALFVTDLPKPSLYVSPTVIRGGFTPDGSIEGEITITNTNPNVTVSDVNVDGSALDGAKASTPAVGRISIEFANGSSLLALGTLGPGQTVRVPYRLRFANPGNANTAARGLGSLVIAGNYIYQHHEVSWTGRTSSQVLVYYTGVGSVLPVRPVSVTGGGIGGFVTESHSILELAEVVYYVLSQLLPSRPCFIRCPPPAPDPVPVQPIGNTRAHGYARIRIEQKLTFERQAFNAELEVIPGSSPITEFRASVKVTDSAGADATGLFDVFVTGQPIVPISNLSTAKWLIVPGEQAGGTAPTGVKYTATATIAYTVGGVRSSFETLPDDFTVKPLPRLRLKYHQPFYVVAGTPFQLAVDVENIGYGDAKNVRIDSAQPRIVSANIPVAFAITGSSSSSADSGLVPGNVAIDFGTIPAGQTRSGYWLMTTTMAGYFIDFDFTMTHVTPDGARQQPLVTIEHDSQRVSNVIFLPGIEGSRLYRKPDDPERVWEPGPTTLGCLSDTRFEHLTPLPDGRSAEQIFTRADSSGGTNDHGVVARALECDVFGSKLGGQKIYADLIEFLDALLPSRGTGARWAAFPYDWRFPCGFEGGADCPSPVDQLAALARDLSSRSDTQKVTLVAHSLGGFLAKQLVLREDMKDKIDNVILVASPQLGMPSALEPMLFGRQYPMTSASGFWGWLDPFRLRPSSVVDAVTKMNATYLGVPGDEFFRKDVADGPFVRFDGSLKQPACGAQALADLADYRGLQSFLMDGSDRLRSAATSTCERKGDIPSTGNQAQASWGYDRHADLDDFRAPEGVGVFQFVGRGLPTPCRVVFSGELDQTATKENFRFFLDPVNCDGDGSVPVKSGAVLSVPTYYFDLSPSTAGAFGPTHRYSNLPDPASHSTIFTDERVREQLREVLICGSSSLSCGTITKPGVSTIPSVPGPGVWEVHADWSDFGAKAAEFRIVDSVGRTLPTPDLDLRAQGLPGRNVESAQWGFPRMGP